ncbi:MAG: hypothetical protein PHV34_18870 [Verrucomicrobiae bacterium]|nr:hypothetical protein [Verrucomicrobiae bacterium]
MKIFPSILPLLAFCLSFGVRHAVAAKPVCEWASPVKLAVATCATFPGKEEVLLGSETAKLLKAVAQDDFRMASSKIFQWNDRSAADFRKWSQKVGEKGDAETTLLFYFSTLQRSDGGVRFSLGPDLKGEKLVEAVNAVAAKYKRVLFVNDSSYAARLEDCGKFSDKVIRLYACDDDEPALLLGFEKVSTGLDEFVQAERIFMRMRFPVEPKGMSFLGLVGLKAGLKLKDFSENNIDLQTWFKRMQHWRDFYTDHVKQPKAPRLILEPSDANFEMVKIPE